MERLKRPADTSPRPPTTQLGDWTAHLLFTRRGQIVLCVAEQTLLPILPPGRDMATLARRVRAAVGAMLEAIGEPAEAIRGELEAMADAPCSPIAMKSPRRASRRVFETAE